MHPSHSTAAIILAAGRSSRMTGGQHKLLLPLNDLPVLAHTIEAALGSSTRPILLIVGHQAANVRASLSNYLTHPDIHIIENPNYAEGMSTSISTALHFIVSSGYKKFKREIDSAIILLGDQPLMTSQVIDTLIDTWHRTPKPIVAPLYSGKRGNPILFAARLFPELMEITGDEGGRSILKRHNEEIATVEVGDEFANSDVDTWEAYQEVVNIWQERKGK